MNMIEKLGAFIFSFYTFKDNDHTIRFIPVKRWGHTEKLDEQTTSSYLGIAKRNFRLCVCDRDFYTLGFERRIIAIELFYGQNR